MMFVQCVQLGFDYKLFVRLVETRATNIYNFITFLCFGKKKTFIYYFLNGFPTFKLVLSIVGTTLTDIIIIRKPTIVSVFCSAFPKSKLSYASVISDFNCINSSINDNFYN